MKEYEGLFTKVCSFENLYQAYLKARKGKRLKPDVAWFENRQEDELVQLQDELLQGIWKPGGYHHFYIHDPKRRLISAAPFRDRVVHHALCNVLEPIWERSFIFDSYANRLRKGTHRAILRCHEFARENPYVLQCDIQKFFPSIDHSILREMIARKTPNPGVLWVIDQILVSGLSAQTEEPQMRWFPGDDLFSPLRPRGLPIGNLTSQFWANVYLNGFDHFVKRELRCKAYVRYVDDFLLFSHSKEVLWDWAEAIARKMDGLRLNLHPLQVFPVRTGIPFLGFRIFPTHRRLKKKRGIAFQKRFRWKYDQMCRDEIPRDNLDTTVRSWVAHASWGDTWGLRRKILGKYVLPPTKRELRMKKE